ncbi:class I SAM-dependent methyltransferase [Paenibacillus sp. D9]|nr:class I SAM-dependent methyltransferase [Paenibacillus sp. D9]
MTGSREEARFGGRLRMDFDESLQDSGEAFSGWDFGYLTATGRMIEYPLPWSYRNLLEPYKRAASSMLDMGTGGGEFLQRLKPLPPDTRATEGHLPNVEVARRRLEEEGVQVACIESDEDLPYGDESFDLIINRHESYCAAELHRLLKPGGIFITQQVGGSNDREFNERLGQAPPAHADWTLDRTRGELEAAGLQLIWQDEVLTHTRFYDIGAVVCYLTIIEWQVVGFSPSTHRDALKEIHDEIERRGWLDVTCHRFVLAAAKPA